MKIITGAKDLAGNPLASNFVSSFTTGATADITAPTVSSTSPRDLQTNVVINKTIAATFSKPIDPLTMTTANFKLVGPGSVSVIGTVNYDATSMIATFTPSSNLAPNTTFTATITGGANGVKDLAGNPLASDMVWTFTTGTQVAQAPINLGSASTFAVMATASISGTGPDQINGDVGLNPGTAQGISPSQVNGSIHIDDQAIIKAQSDLRAAYQDAVGRSLTTVSLPGNMGGLTFTPGLYTNSTSVLIQGAGPANNVTLDAQGDPNAIFIFQMGSTLTTGPGAQVILAGGAKAGNIFWQVGSSATLNTTTIFKGNILAAVTITVNNGSAIEGRLLAGSNSDGSSDCQREQCDGAEPPDLRPTVARKLFTRDAVIRAIARHPEFFDRKSTSPIQFLAGESCAASSFTRDPLLGCPRHDVLPRNCHKIRLGYGL